MRLLPLRDPIRKSRGVSFLGLLHCGLKLPLNRRTPLRRFFVNIERLGFNFPPGLLEQNHDSALSFFELLLAFARKRHAFFEEPHCFVQRKIRALQPFDYFFEPAKRAFEIPTFRCFGYFINCCSQICLVVRKVASPMPIDCA